VDEDGPFHRKVAYRVARGPNVDFLGQKASLPPLYEPNTSPMLNKPVLELPQNDIAVLCQWKLYERATVYYIRAALQQNEGLLDAITNEHFVKFFHWMKAYLGSERSQILICGATEAEEASLLEESTMSEEHWHAYLSKLGFNGLEISLGDIAGLARRNSVMVSQSMDKAPVVKAAFPVAEVGSEATTEASIKFSADVASSLINRGQNCNTVSWDSHTVESSKIHIILVDAEQPLLTNPTSQRFQ
jgi:hypothetical protein